MSLSLKSGGRGVRIPQPERKILLFQEQNHGLGGRGDKLQSGGGGGDLKMQAR